MSNTPSIRFTPTLHQDLSKTETFKPPTETLKPFQQLLDTGNVTQADIQYASERWQQTVVDDAFANLLDAD